VDGALVGAADSLLSVLDFCFLNTIKVIRKVTLSFTPYPHLLSVPIPSPFSVVSAE
jgi:hypothetical protein